MAVLRPEQDENHPAGSITNIPFVAKSLTNPGPADVVAGPGAAPYVSDDTAGAIYRLVPAP